MDRTKAIFEKEVSKGQTGFRSELGTGIFNIRAVLEKTIAINKDIYICFMDFQKGFDSVYHKKIMEFLNYTRMDKKDLRVIRNLYWEQKAVARLQNGNSEEFNIDRVVRQGCMLSPKLFNLCTEDIFGVLEELLGLSVGVGGGGGGGGNISNFQYADDTAQVADREEKLQKIVNKVKEQRENLRLYMNVSNTKTMMVNKAGEERNIAIDVDGQELEQVRDFRYLGQIITDDGRCDKEVKRRIAIARNNYINMKDVLATWKLKWDTRMRLVRCYILSTLLYASETWVLNAETEGRIKSLEMWIYRRMLKISYQEHISNEDIFSGLKCKTTAHENDESKCRYFGHIVRGER